MCDIGAGDVLLAFPSENEALRAIVDLTIEISDVGLTAPAEDLRQVHRSLSDDQHYPFAHEVRRLRVRHGREQHSVSELYRSFARVCFQAGVDHADEFPGTGLASSFLNRSAPFYASTSNLWTSSNADIHTFNLLPSHDDALNALGVVTKPSAAGVTIGVLDTGIDDANRPANIADRINAIDYDDIAMRADVSDGTGHGTLVTELISTVVDDASYKIVKVFTSTGCSSDWHLLLGLSLLHDCDVLNMSFESGLAGQRFGCAAMGHGSTSALFEAVLTTAMRDRSNIYVAAAGNGGRSELAYPAKFHDVVAVQSINGSGELSQFSNRGLLDHADQPHPHVLVAPGGEFSSAASAPEEDLAESADGTRRFWGTSFAAAYVTGVIAAHVASERQRISAGIDRAAILSRVEAGSDKDPAWFTAAHGHGLPQIP